MTAPTDGIGRFVEIEMRGVPKVGDQLSAAAVGNRCPVNGRFAGIFRFACNAPENRKKHCRNHH
jgi:hypothetical protein